MVELISEKTEIATEASMSATRPNRVLRSSRFKYYIHDGIDACRFQLIGELAESEVPELNGCWRTAKTTLGKRKLILDLRGLRALDGAGTKWVTAMASEGAECVPGAVFQNGVFVPPASDSASQRVTGKPSPLSRLLAIFRGFRAPSPESSTPAQ